MNEPSNKILITGGGGFIGTHLAERLSGKAEIILYDNFRRDSLSLAPGLHDNPRVTLVRGDVLDLELVEKTVGQADTVLHLAAIAGVSSYYEDPLKTLQVNLLGTVNVLEAARRCGVRSFIYFSTSEVYGPDALWVTEESPHGIGPVSDRRWTYASSKLAAENFALRYSEVYRFACSVIRPFNVYGPRQTGEGAVSNFCRAVSQGRPITIHGDGSPIRAWCFISDLIDAVEAVLDAPQAAGEVFNIGNPREVETTLGLARRFQRLAPEVKIEFVDVPRTEVKARIPVIQKARDILGFEPKVDLDEGLRRTLEWFGRHGA